MHTQFIGEILDIKADEDILDAKGLPRIEGGWKELVMSREAKTDVSIYRFTLPD